MRKTVLVIAMLSVSCGDLLNKTSDDKGTKGSEAAKKIPEDTSSDANTKEAENPKQEASKAPVKLTEAEAMKALIEQLPVVPVDRTSVRMTGWTQVIGGTTREMRAQYAESPGVSVGTVFLDGQQSSATFEYRYGRDGALISKGDISPTMSTVESYFDEPGLVGRLKSLVYKRGEVLAAEDTYVYDVKKHVFTSERTRYDVNGKNPRIFRATATAFDGAFTAYLSLKETIETKVEGSTPTTETTYERKAIFDETTGAFLGQVENWPDQDSKICKLVEKTKLECGYGRKKITDKKTDKVGTTYALVLEKSPGFAEVAMKVLTSFNHREISSGGETLAFDVTQKYKYSDDWTEVTLDEEVDYDGTQRLPYSAGHRTEKFLPKVGLVKSRVFYDDDKHEELSSSIEYTYEPLPK